MIADMQGWIADNYVHPEPVAERMVTLSQIFPHATFKRRFKAATRAGAADYVHSHPGSREAKQNAGNDGTANRT